MLRELELLFDRELYDLCYYKVQKAEELATKYEKLPVLFEILSWKRKLGTALSSNQSDIDSILQKEEAVLVQIKYLNTYLQRTYQLVRLIDDDVIVNDLKTTKFDAIYVLQSQILHFHILCGLSFIKGDIAASEKSVSDLIELLESFPEGVKDAPMHMSRLSAIKSVCILLLNAGSKSRHC